MAGRLVLQLLAVATSVMVVEEAEAAKTNVGCIVRHCLSPVQRCMGDERCRSMLGCLTRCRSGDERCTIACSLRDGRMEAPAVEEMLGCFVRHDCLSADDDKPGDTACPLPTHHRTMNVSLAAFEGRWYVPHGLSRVFDCWSCQTMTFEAMNATHLAYDYAMAIDGKPHEHRRHIPCTLSRVDDHLLASYSISPLLQGVDHWYVLYAANNAMLLYYCGASALSLPYQGAVLMTRSPEATLHSVGLSSRLLNAMFTNAGLNLSWAQFCQNDQSPVRCSYETALRQSRSQHRLLLSIQK